MWQHFGNFPQNFSTNIQPTLLNQYSSKENEAIVSVCQYYAFEYVYVSTTVTYDFIFSKIWKLKL